MAKSPWLADAAKGATGETYEIRTVFDFLKVPEDRRRICLREFHAWLMLHESIQSLIQAGLEAAGAPIQSEAISFRGDCFRWVDDGKAIMTVLIHGKGGDDGAHLDGL